MYLELEQRLSAAVRAFLLERYGFRPSTWVVEQPPRPEMGEFALTVCFDLAKQQRRPPRQLAQEMATAFPLPPGFSSVTVAGGGYLNFAVDRRLAMSAPAKTPPQELLGKVIVEHTSINPNKAAHIGHLRNAVLGDVLGRSLKSLGYPVEIQNYIDDTGVQLADVVVGFIDLRGLSFTQVAALPEPFDFFCWDLYREVG
ncbi:MAG: arginine--tRNA ligase, partial [Terriglobales bacterium]